MLILDASSRKKSTFAMIIEYSNLIVWRGREKNSLNLSLRESAVRTH